MSRRSGLGQGSRLTDPHRTHRACRVRHSRRFQVAAIRPNPLQPRSHFDEEAMSSLAASIREVGVLQPHARAGPGRG